MVNQGPWFIQSLDFSQVRIIENLKSEDGSPSITYDAELEAKLRQLVARYGIPRLPFSAAELDALISYAAYLEACRADELPENQYWQRSALAQAEEFFPGYAPGLRLFIAGDVEGLLAHHRTSCGYKELIEYEKKYYYGS